MSIRSADFDIVGRPTARTYARTLSSDNTRGCSEGSPHQTADDCRWRTIDRQSQTRRRWRNRLRSSTDRPGRRDGQLRSGPLRRRILNPLFDIPNSREIRRRQPLHVCFKPTATRVAHIRYNARRQMSPSSRNARRRPVTKTAVAAPSESKRRRLAIRRRPKDDIRIGRRRRRRKELHAQMAEAPTNRAEAVRRQRQEDPRRVFPIGAEPFDCVIIH